VQYQGKNDRDDANVLTATASAPLLPTISKAFALSVHTAQLTVPTRKLTVKATKLKHGQLAEI
jgi:hypothetical protein